MCVPLQNSTRSVAWIGSTDLSSVSGISVEAASRALRRAHESGTPWRGVSLTVRAVPGSRGRKGMRYEVLVSSLPEMIQARYHLAAPAGAEPVPPASGPETALQSTPINSVSTEAWAAFEQLSGDAQERAGRRLSLVDSFFALESTGLAISERLNAAAAEHGVNPHTLRRWVARVKGMDRADWLPALAPRYRGGVKEAEFTPEAWDFILANWGVLTRPSLTSIVDRARRLAPERGWVIPDYRTVLNRINALPAWQTTLMRQGTKALARMFPAQRRDYTTLRVHDLWESDGRRADVFCRWPDGTVARPILMVFRCVRTRMVLGHKVGRTESADLVRLAFREAAKTANAIPSEVLLDNGRAYASKMMTGGQKNRYRGKIKPEDPLGVLTAMGVNVVWATPGHGQAKPVESFFNTIADRVDKRFTGAYCGNRPDARPEDFDPARAIPVEDYEAAVKREIALYHQRAHRGLDRKSPREVYQQLIIQARPKRPTAAQLRMCLLAAESVKLSAQDHSVTILGNRYWCEELAALPHRGPFTVRFDPEDATVPVSVYDGGRFVAEAPMVGRTGFRDQEAAKAHNRNRRAYVNSKKKAVQAVQRMAEAEEWPVDAPGPAVPPPSVVELFRPPDNLNGTPPDEENEVDVAGAFRRGVEKMRRAAGM